jgi:hypothetical protein
VKRLPRRGHSWNERRQKLEQIQNRRQPDDNGIGDDGKTTR